MPAYRVTAPYVTLKVKDFNGVSVVQGYYLDGVVQDPVQDEQFDRHLDKGWIEPVQGTDEEESAEPEPSEPEGFERPHGNAGRDAWATYALESGQASEDEVADMSRDELRDKYGK